MSLSRYRKLAYGGDAEAYVHLERALVRQGLVPPSTHPHPKPYFPEYTPVIFRKWKNTGALMAFFPSIPGDSTGTTCTVYGTHGECHGKSDHDTYIRYTRPSTSVGSRVLKGILEEIGYSDLKVYKRWESVFDWEREREILMIRRRHQVLTMEIK